MWLFSLGPAPTLMGNPFMYRGPYTLLMYLPGFNSLRVPARFWMTVTLCLAVIGAMVFARLTEKLGRLRLAAAAIVALGVLADTWMTAMPLAATPKPFAALVCGGTATGPIVELPLGQTYPDVAAMYRQMSHHRPLVNGYSGYFPPHYAALRFGLMLRDHDVLSQLAAHGVTDIIVDREPDPDGHWDRYVASHPHAALICTEGKQSLYRVTPAESARCGGCRRHAARDRRHPPERQRGGCDVDDRSGPDDTMGVGPAVRSHGHRNRSRRRSHGAAASISSSDRSSKIFPAA